MEGSAEGGTPGSVWERILSVLSTVTKYHALLGTGLSLVLLTATYLFFDRGKLHSQNELLQKRLEAEQNQTQILQSQHSEQLRTYQISMESLAKALEAEKEYTKNLQEIHKGQIETVKIIMAIQGRIPAALKEQFNAITQKKVAQR